MANAEGGYFLAPHCFKDKVSRVVKIKAFLVKLLQSCVKPYIGKAGNLVKLVSRSVYNYLFWRIGGKLIDNTLLLALLCNNGNVKFTR